MDSKILQKYVKQLLNDESLFIVALDNEARVSFANRKAEQTFHDIRDSGPMVGKNWLQLAIPKEQQSLMQARFRAILSGAVEPLSQVSDVDNITASGRRLRILWSNHLLRDDEGRILGTLSFGQDITEQQKNQQRISLHQEVAALLGESISFRDACEKLIRLIGKRFGWEYGEIWLVDSIRQRLVWQVACSNAENDFSQFREFSQRLSFSKGEGLPGLIWEQEKPTWLEDVVNIARFVRRFEAKAAGLHSGMGFPIRVGDDIYGIMVFLSQRIQPPDQGLIALFESVGVQLGNRFIREKAEAQLKIWDELFRNSGEAMFVTDAVPRILTVNQAFSRLLGYKAEEVTGRSPVILQSNRHDQQFYDQLWTELNESGNWQGEVWEKRKDGSECLIGLTISRIKNEQGEPSHYIATLADISQRKAAEERIQYLVYHDALTGLPNRALLMERLDRALAVAQRNHRHVAVISVDVDRFKVVNDSLGHAVGDLILQQMSQRLQRELQEVDILCRPGGDEFIIVQSNISELNSVVMLADRLVQAVRRPMLVGEMEFNLTASIGISVYPGDGTDRESLLKNADVAMNYAKELGRNQFVFFTADLNELVSERLKLETYLRKALERNELFVHYQPQVDLRTYRVVGLEALVRWQHPEEGMISPAKFIPIAEETGLIIPLGDWILEEACREWGLLADAGLPPVELAVNISAVQFYEPGFLEKISRRVKDSNVESFLEIEVTEGVMMRNIPATIDIMHKLKAIGCKLSIDDFGTGYSSLGYLSRFPLDKLKIDQSFVRAMLASQTNMAIVDTIIKLANNLNLRVIAEGVETVAELNALRVRNCDEVQGYYFAKPMPLAELIPWWRQWNKLR